MSVRRLAEPAVQPASFAFTKANAAWAKQTIRKYPKGREQSAVIPLLMRAQEQEGWVTRAAIEHVAEMLDMPHIRVLEVATFYTQYQLQPVGTRAHVQVCGTTPCMLRGAGELMDVCRSKIHPEQFHTNADGTLSWEEVECLGACVNAPMVMIFKDTYEDLTPERLEEIIDAFEKGRGKSVTPGPQVERVYSAPASGMTSLQDERAVLKSTREREARAAARAAKEAEAGVPPSRAAKPKTDKPETSAGLKTPSPVKASPAAEKRTSAKDAPINRRAANLADPVVEDAVKQRKGLSKRAPVTPKNQSPELLKGRPIGPGGKMQAGEAAAPKGVPSPDGKLAARTASGSARGKDAKPSLDSKDRPAAVARPAKPDDLQLISGVGPKIEATLHSLGIFTYAQVASWKKAERDWVDGYLSFSGRIEREDWVKQAKALAKGGAAEYIRVFGKKPR